MNYQQGQIHLIKTIIQLKKVAITVRFPCSISFALKYQNNVVDHKGVYELVKGQSTINQSIQIEVQVPYLRGRYEQKKLSLLICMVSANGRIPAGTVTINPTDKIIIDKKSPLEKCPDKNAEVTFTESYQKIKVLKQIADIKKSRVNLAASTVSGFNYLNKSQAQYASTSALLRHGTQTDLQQNDDENGKEKLDYSFYRNNNQKSLRNSQAGSDAEKRNFTKFSKNRVEDGSRRNLYGTTEKQHSQMRLSRASNQVAEGLQWEVESQKSKILKLEQEKTGYIKQIAKLRGSLVRVDSEDRFQIEDQFHRIKTEKTELQDEVEKLKEKSKFQEKRQRQSGSVLKQLRDELDKKKSRIAQLDTSRHQIQGQLSQKDRLINSLQSQKRKLQQSLQQQKALQQSYQKRLDIKQNSYKEQIKKINEKYSQSEAERQKAMLDYNNLLLQIQNTEKRNQTLLRQKEKLSIEEKNKLNKKIEQQLLEITELQEKLSDKINLIRDYEYYKKKSAEEQKQKNEKIQSLKENYEDLMVQNKKLKQEQKSLQEQLRNLEATFNEDKINYKKKYIESSNQILLFKEKVQKATINNNNLDTKIKELEARLQKQSKQKIIINTKFEQLRKIQQKYVEEEQARERLAQTLSMENINQNNKLSEFKSRLQSERKKYEVMETKYEEQVQYLVKSKDYLQNQLQEHKWLLEKEAEKYEVLSIKYRQLNNQIIELNQQIIQKQEIIASFDHERAQYSNKISQFQLEISRLQSKHKNITDSLKKKQEEYFTIEKKGSSYQQELFLLQTNFQKVQRDLNDKIEGLQKAIDAKNIQIKDKERELILVNEEIYGLRSLSEKLKNEINNKNNEIIVLKQQIESIQQDYASLLDKNEKNKIQLHCKEQQVEELENKMKAKTSECEMISLENQKRKQSFQQYKQTNKKVFEQLFHYLTKQQYLENAKQNANMELFPDPHLSKLQSECTSRVYSNHQRQQQSIKSQTFTISNLQQTISKLKAQISSMNQGHQNRLNQQFELQKALKAEKNQEIASLNDRITELTNLCEDKTSEIQFLSSSVNKYEDMISEFTEEQIKNSQKINEMKLQIDSLQKQVYEFKEKQLKTKLLASTESEDLKSLFKQQKQRYDEAAQNFRQIIQAKDKQINEKVEQLKKWVLIESELRLQQIKHVEQLKQLGTKLQNQTVNRKNVQKNIQEKEKFIKQLQEEISNHKSSLQIQRSKEKHSQEQIKRVQGQLHNMELIYKALQQEQRYKSNNIQQNQKKQRQKREKLEAIKLKLEQQNKQVREKCVKLESEIEFYKFYKEQSHKKISEYEKMKEENFMEMVKCRENIIRSERQIGNFENKQYKLQMEIEQLLKDKEMTVEANNRLQQKLEEFEEKSQKFNQTLNELESRNKEIARLQETISIAQQKNQKINAQLRNTLAQLKEELTAKSNKIKELQKKIDDKNADLNVERQKIQTQYENEKNMYQIKLETYQQNMRVLQQQLQFQKQQATKEVEGANAIIQELNEVIRQKQDTLQYREDLINEQNVRLEELNLQLVECVNKWEKEKEIYMPASTKITQISDELIRMNKFISELDGRNKQLLEVNKRKMQQTLQNKPSFTQILKEFYVVMQKSKNRILNRCQTQKEKQTVMLQFKAVQQKLDLTLKSTQIVTAKQ